MASLFYLLLIVAIWIAPSHAFAFGPNTHLELGISALNMAALFAPAAARLISRFADDFLYGNIIADIVLGKNGLPYRRHCHNWQVGARVFSCAANEPSRAMALGYLCHLAADTVAHNYYVPMKLVESFDRRALGHTYWEVRFDAHVPGEAGKIATRLMRGEQGAHRAWLRQALTPNLLNLQANGAIFHGIVGLQNLSQWRRLVAWHGRNSPRELEEGLVAEVRALAVGAMLELLAAPDEVVGKGIDPTGERNLKVARNLARVLRLNLGREGKDAERRRRIAVRLRPRFRSAITAPLVLPDLAELASA